MFPLKIVFNVDYYEIILITVIIIAIKFKFLTMAP